MGLGQLAGDTESETVTGNARIRPRPIKAFENVRRPLWRNWFTVVLHRYLSFAINAARINANTTLGLIIFDRVFDQILDDQPNRAPVPHDR